MVSSITALTRSGLKDWYVQRISAVVLVLYVAFLIGVLVAYPHISFMQWQFIFSHVAVKVFTLLALLSMIAHAWIGIWTVLTDYVHHGAIRGVVQTIIILTFFSCLLWGVWILWS